ncbi:hypothetical protein CCR87_02345 [Rhodobaculum claviforme]|uniref:Phospholipase D n=1 Tax=Rhodobaculum claviforme TaxID=1549854 RepID=A0A934TJ78_9RHOB|nr:hypothetical protein [Rhodobaculum claviforme]
MAGFEAERLGARGGAPSDRLTALHDLAGAVDGGPLPPVPLRPGEGSFPSVWRTAEMRLPLDARPPLGAPVVVFPGVHAATTVVHLDAIAGQPLAVSGRCDGTVRPRDTTGPLPDAAPGQPFRLTIGPAPRDGSRLTLGADVSRCTLDIRAATGGHSLTLRRDTVADPALAALDARLDVCAVPPLATLDALERVALSDRWLSRTCLGPTGPSRLLTDGLAAFNAKAEALTGRPLPRAALEAGDPAMPIDFSHAPALELIVVTSLQLRADFTGRMLGRMLAHHAARGTPVRILVSQNLATGPDRRMLARLAADWPMVQIQAYHWRPAPGITPTTLPDRLQRSQHTKVFGVLGRAPGTSRFMVGGRNLHDGFVFDSPRDLSGRPGLHDYTRRLRAPLAYFAAYEDLELEITDPAAVRAMMAHMGTLWQRDAPSGVVRPFSLTAEVPGAPRTGAFHILSMPQSDGRALEQWLVALIDATATRLDIASPYLNPTPAVAAALERAVARGVRVRVVTPRVVGGDPLDGFKAALKQMFLDRLTGLEVWEVAQPDRLLHSKFLIFDGRLSLVTSANLNARSLVHDTENGIAVLDPGFAARLTAVHDGYVARATPLTAATPVGPLRRWLLRPEAIRNWF